MSTWSFSYPIKILGLLVALAAAVQAAPNDSVLLERQELMSTIHSRLLSLIESPNYRPLAAELIQLRGQAQVAETFEAVASARQAYEAWERRAKQISADPAKPEGYAVVYSGAFGNPGPVTSARAEAYNKGHVVQPPRLVQPAAWTTQPQNGGESRSAEKNPDAVTAPTNRAAPLRTAALRVDEVRNVPTPQDFRRVSATPPLPVHPSARQAAGFMAPLGRAFDAAGDAIREGFDAAINTVTGLLKAPLAFLNGLRLRISSMFGMRINPVTGKRTFHAGVDYAAPVGTPVQAGGDGVVIIAGWLGGYGNAVVIQHGGGLETLYGHLSVLGVRRGQQVGRGMIIAKSGATGRVTGPHLHYETRRDGVPFNPLGH